MQSQMCSVVMKSTAAESDVSVTPSDIPAQQQMVVQVLRHTEIHKLQRCTCCVPLPRQRARRIQSMFRKSKQQQKYATLALMQISWVLPQVMSVMQSNFVFVLQGVKPAQSAADIDKLNAVRA